ncbi:unnamed protein product [Prunus armeniaca]
MEDDATQLVIQLEDNLGLREMGEVKISVVKDNLLAITVELEEMARRIIEGGLWAVMGYALSTHHWEERMAIVEWMTQTKGYCGFLRLKVELDARRPLVEGFWIPRRNKMELWAEIRFPHGGFDIFTMNLRAKAFSPSFWRGAGGNTGRNYQSILSMLARGNQASEIEREQDGQGEIP